MAERQVRVAVIMDDESYLRGGANVVSTNTKIAASNESLAVNAKKAADAQIAGILRVREASKLRIAELSKLQASAPNFETQTAATVALQRENAKLARTYGETAVATGGFSRATKEGERDLNKLVRGGLAGSGALSALGRSLAFASTGFIAFATGATIIKASISAAQDEVVAQKQVARQLQTSGKSWAQYGTQIDKALLKESHLAGFTKAQLLQSFGYLLRVGGNVQNSLKLTGLAADIARARSISLASASLALSKALGGSATALRRLGIIVPKNTTTTQALAYVTAKFAGQAEAGTTVSQKFQAVLTDTGATIGKALLPTFTRLATELSDWLAKMNESGRLQKDVNQTVSIAGDVFHTLEGAIKAVDKVTGSFKHTLELLFAIWSVKKMLALSDALVTVAAKWGLVATAASSAAAAEESAAAAGTAAAAGGVAAGGAGAAAAVTAGPVAAGLGAFGLIAASAAAALPSGTGPSRRLPGRISGRNTVLVSGLGVFQKVDGQWFRVAGRATQPATADQAALAESILNGTGLAASPPRLEPGLSGRFPGRSFAPGIAARGRPTVFAQFTNLLSNQLAQARAALTRSTADDVAAARAEIAFIKREIAAGHLKGQSLIQALSAEAGAYNTIQSAIAADAQKRAAQIADSLDPAKLELALAQAQLAGNTTDIKAAYRRLIAAAKKALITEKLSIQDRITAIQNIIGWQQALKSATQQTTVQFQVPARLALRLARDQALGRDTTRDLLAIRAAILRFIRHHRKNIAALTDAYNQLASINDQLGSSAQSALGAFKQASTRALTAGLHLSAADRKLLRARLSQLGPGGTVPGSGTGAYGYIIGKDDRPLVVHTHVNVDGKRVADNTTRHQQRRRRRNPPQRRGPHAGE